MDSRIGLDYIVENAEYTTKLGAGKWHKTKFYYGLLLKNIANKIYQKRGKFESLNEHKILLRHLFKKRS